MLVPNFVKLNLSDGEELYTGWKPRYLDRRDYHEFSPEVQPAIAKLKLPTVGDFPELFDLEGSFPPIKNQLTLGSCIAQAATNMVEYYQLKAFDKYVPGSRLFLYKVARNLQRETGDTGGYLRTAMAALALFGVPPEEYLPYDIGTFDWEPSQFLYSMADNYEATCYFCHDPMLQNISGEEVLNRVKKYILAGIPSMFGFYIFTSFKSGSAIGDGPNVGYVPFPGNDEPVKGGHAVVVVGYDDVITIKNDATGQTTQGALKFINSWGANWGFNGYGYIPYRYVETGLACDFWSIISMRWLDTGRFGL